MPLPNSSAELTEVKALPKKLWAIGSQTVRVWDATSGQEFLCLTQHGNWADCVAWSGDSRRLVSGSEDKAIRVWDATNGQELLCIRGHEGAVKCVAWSGDGRNIASGSKDKTARVWDATNGQELLCLRGHENAVTSVAWSVDGRRLVSGSEDKTVRVWDATNGEEVLCLRGLGGTVQNLAWSNDGRFIASSDEAVRKWSDIIHGIANNTNDLDIARRLNDRTVRVWDAESGEPLEIVEGSRDVTVVASGQARFQWWAIETDLETLIHSAAGGKRIAWFPESLEHITTHPNGRTWAGAVGSYLALVTLEGAPSNVN